MNLEEGQDIAKILKRLSSLVVGIDERRIVQRVIDNYNIYSLTSKRYGRIKYSNIDVFITGVSKRNVVVDFTELSEIFSYNLSVPSRNIKSLVLTYILVY